MRIVALGLMASTSFLCLTTMTASDKTPGVGVPASVHFNRGANQHASQELDKAIAHYNDAIRLDPAYASAYCARGLARFEKNDTDRAIADYTEAIRLDPKLPWPYNNRGNAWVARQEFARAIADYDEAIRLEPSFGAALNNRVRLWATCTDQKVRDGKLAVKSATQACELSDWKNPNDLETLAAAYAETGEFDQAVKTQSRAIALAKHYDRELKLYHDKQPLRATVAAERQLSNSRPVAFSAEEKSRSLFTVPYDAVLYLTALGGTASAVSEFGLGTNEVDRTPIFTGLPADPEPKNEVKIGFVAAGSELYFYLKTEWGGDHWAFSHDTKSNWARVAFEDQDNSLGRNGSIVEKTSMSTWLLHLDDAASSGIDDNDEDVLIEIRLVPTSPSTPKK
jgi:tetratricopeptide (TPR) repeat protein